MTIKELDNELMNVIETIADNWAKSGDVDEIPRIMQYAFDGFRESIIDYLDDDSKLES